jgi:hypothetical protein
MTTIRQIEEARPRLAYLLRAIVRRVQRDKIGADRYRNLSTELADHLRAAVVASRTTMQFLGAIANRFDVDLSDDGEGRPVAAFLPEPLAGALSGASYEGCRVVSWAMIAQHTPLEAVRIVVNEHDGPAFYVTFAQVRPSGDDAEYFRAPPTAEASRWEGLLPGEDMQSPKQHRAWFTLVSPLAHGHDEKAGNVVLFRRQRQVDPFTGEHALVPVYTGNAMKGAWRDAFFARMLRAVGVAPERDLSPRRAQELFSGGTIESGADGATAKLDIRRRARETIPPIDLLGGCIEQQIMSGLLRVHDCTLLCRENAWKVYRMLAPRSAAGDALPFEDFRASLPPADDLTILRLGTRHAHREMPGGGDGVQMLWNTEAIMPGARLMHAFSIVSLSTVSPLARSCLADLLQDFADTGLLGAQTARGYGQISTTGYVPAEKTEPLPSSDEYLAYLAEHRAEILAWLAGTKDDGGADDAPPAPKNGGRRAKKAARPEAS